MEPPALSALLWDVDGTLAETERDGHRVAFDEAFASLGLPWRWDVAHYGVLLRITGGLERLRADLDGRPDAPADPAEREALARELHRRKNAAYARRVAAGAIGLRPGVRALIDEAEALGVRQAIVTTTSRDNVDALLRRALGTGWRQRFAAVVCGEDVTAKKPDPEAYRLALSALGVPPVAAVAIEDAPAGVVAACGAGVPVIVTRSTYFPDDPVAGALAVGPGLHDRTCWVPRPVADGPQDRDAGIGGRVTLDDLVHWLAAA